MKIGMQMIVQTKLLAIALLLFGSVTCSAQQLNFSIDGGNSFGNSFNIASGSSTNVDVFLSEVPPDTTLSTAGLFSLGLAADLDSAAFGTISSADLNPVYDFITTDSFNTIAIEWEAAVLANTIPTGSSIRLGSFQFDSTAAGVSSFTFGDSQPGSGGINDNWFTGSGVLLDDLIFGAGSTGTFSLTLNSAAVPEPGTVSLILFGTMLAGFRRRK